MIVSLHGKPIAELRSITCHMGSLPSDTVKHAPA